jgi:hypothetical protein
MLSIVSNPLIKQKYQVVVRWHPAKINLGQKDKATINDLINSDSELIHIRPEDQDDTYRLVQDAAVILTFGSTVGYVAALTGKPVVIAGPMAKVFKTSFYSAKSPKQATELLLSDLEPRDPFEIELIGYYSKNFGLKMENVLMKKEGRFLNSYLIVNESNQHSRYVPIHPKTNNRKIIKRFVNLVNAIKKLVFQLK